MTFDLTTLENAAPILTDPADMQGYVQDWTGRYRGDAVAVALPRDTAEVAAVVKACAALGLKIVPQSGNTSLAAGSIPGTGEGWIVLSLARMNRIRVLDKAARTVTVEAGMILQALHDALAPEGLTFPLTFGAKGSAMIGGNLSSNAGGLNVLRHGTARELCLSLEAVLADGSVIDTGAGLRKDNTGYDLRHLLIGAEGTLGIITAATLRIVPLPKVRTTAFLSVPGLSDALTALNRLQDESGGALEMFEFMPAHATELVQKHFPALRCPLESVPEVGILMEVASASAYDAAPGEDGSPRLQGRIEEALATLFEEGIVLDAAIAQSDAQRENMVALREHVLESLMAEGTGTQLDVSLPLAAIDPFLKGVYAILPEHVRFHVIGHLGDGNLHLSFMSDGADPAPIVTTLYDEVIRHRGSISAEHGIGRSKAALLAARKDPGSLAAMRRIKAALDPDGRMNPGAVLQ